MVWLAGAALAGVWLVQQLPQAPGPELLTVLLPPAALATWCLAGGRACLVVMLAGWTLLRAGWVTADRWPEALAGADVLVRGAICDFPRHDPEASRIVLITEADGLPAALPARLHLSWYETPVELRPGQRWQLLVRLKPPRGLSNPGAFDFEQWLYLRGIGASGYVRPSALNRELVSDAWTCPVGTARGRLAGKISRALQDHRAAGYVLGLAVGATSALRQSDWELLRRTGTTHLLAISGLNIAMVAVPFLLLGRALGRLWPALGIRFPAGPGVMPALAAAALYSALAGFAVSTLRALVMLLTGALLGGRGRAVAGSDLLGCAVLAVLVLDPFAVLSASFWLSFAGVIWLYLAATGWRVTPDGNAETKTRRGWTAMFGHAATLTRVQIILGLGLAPLTIAWFTQISVIAPLTNLLAIPVFSIVVMPLTLLGAIAVIADAGAGSLLLQLAADVLAVLITGLERAAAWSWAIWQPPPVNAPGLILAGLAVLTLCWRRPVPVRWAAVLGLLPVLAGMGDSPSPGTVRVVVMDVGQGLAVLVQTADHALLYDAGPAFRSRDAGLSVVLPVMRHFGIRRLDALLISHGDADHRGGGASVLREFPQARLIATDRSLLKAARFQPCHAGLAWSWDGVRFEILGPEGQGRGLYSENDASCVLLIRASGRSVLLPGDIERGREQALVGEHALGPVDLLLAPHHGSRTSSSAPFVAATRPQFLVVSAGYRNRWGFPAAEVVQRWQGAHACVMTTAEQGALVFEFSADSRWPLRRRQRVDGARVWTVPAVSAARELRRCVKLADGWPL